MSNIREYHSRAMILAEQALEAKIRGDFRRTAALTEKAFAEEASSARYCEQEKAPEPTYSIIHCSAATLGLECKEFDEAEYLVTRAIDHGPPSEMREDLLNLLHKTRNTAGRHVPKGFSLRLRLSGHEGVVTRFAWSPDGTALASASSDHRIRIWNMISGEQESEIRAHEAIVWTVAWSPDGKIIATASEDRTIRLWIAKTGELLCTAHGHAGPIYSLAWSFDGKMIASGSADCEIGIWDFQARHLTLRTRLPGHWTGVNSVAWSRDDKILASGSLDTRMLLRERNQLASVLNDLRSHNAGINNVAWSPNGQFLASGSDDSTIRIWNPINGLEVRRLEGHTDAITRISFSADGYLLASKSKDLTVRLWRCDIWSQIAKLVDPVDQNLIPDPTLVWRSGLAFHPKMDLLAVSDRTHKSINIWHVDRSVVVAANQVSPHLSRVNAKVVLLGESNVGKTCLAMRLAEDRYGDQKSTHGMRFWNLLPENLGQSCAAPPDETREIVVWDMGGQAEYRLLHQLFLEDTTLALVFLDPQRGDSGFDDVEGWVQRLEKQQHGRKVIKLLIGARMDEEESTYDQARVARLVEKYDFADFIETSAKTGRGIDRLKSAIAKHLDWETMTKTTRDRVFQSIRDEIDRLRRRDQVVLLFSDLEGMMRAKDFETFDSQAIEGVVQLLALQGLIAVTRLANGERALVLQIGEIERYGASLIVAARDNPRGVPAVELRRIGTPLMSFPGIKENERLSPAIEKTVVECIVQLLLEKGVCLEHERLLVFPSLFRPSQVGRPEPVSHAVSLYYDFTGAIDNIYASLIAWLAICNEFGRVRLWMDRAEFEKPGKGQCGSRKQEVRNGFAHLDVYFSDDVTSDHRDFFVVLIEDHLRQHGVQISEHIEITCRCGYSFPENTIQLRLIKGLFDVGCPECDRRTMISEGAKAVRFQDPKRIVAVKTRVDRNRRRIVEQAKASIKSWNADEPAQPVRILHLSDLHISASQSPEALVQPLIQDLQCSEERGGLGVTRLSGIIISGDLTNCALPEEFEKACEFTSLLLDAFNLSAQRCVIVPGNHDVDWKIPVYDYEFWRPSERVPSADSRTVINGDIIFTRNGEMYPQRFRNFSRYLYHPLIQQEYPLEYAEQGIPFLFDGAGVQILAFNSSWEIDKFFPKRCSISSEAISRTLLKADEQAEVSKDSIFKSARVFGRPVDGGSISLLRIAVWHHPVSGNERISDDAFLERLARAGIALSIHGHLHELTPAFVNHVHPQTRLHIAGTGSFGAPTAALPGATPRLYSLLEIPLDHSYIRMHTRCQFREDGIWQGWAVWPSNSPTEKRTYYDIPVEPKRLFRLTI